MKRVPMSLVAGLLVLTVALPALAAKPEPEVGPPGPYQMGGTEVETCELGGSTTYTWAHLKVYAVRIFWVDEGYDEIASTDEIRVSPKPFGSITVPTPAGAWRMGTIVNPYGGGVSEFCG